MQPKIVYNEECVDLRGNFQSVMPSRVRKNGNHKPIVGDDHGSKPVRNESNETVNTALKKLARTYNSNFNSSQARGRECPFDDLYRNRFSGPQDASLLKSKSELSILTKNSNKTTCPSSPIITSPCENAELSEKVEPYKNKFTMTTVRKAKETFNTGKRLIKDKSLEKLIDQMVTQKASLNSSELCSRPIWNDKRLIEKYSLLKLPWKRSRTLPVYLTQPSAISKQEYQKKLQFCSDKKTYLYDDGSDIDSMVFQEHNRVTKYFGYTFQSQVLALLNVSAYVCAILILSLIVWFVSGNKFFHKLLIADPPESTVKRYFKYICGGIIYFLSSTVRFIGSIFAIPTQQVFHPVAQYPWPPTT